MQYETVIGLEVHAQLLTKTNNQAFKQKKCDKFDILSEKPR